MCLLRPWKSQNNHAHDIILTPGGLIVAYVLCLSQSACAINVAPPHATTGPECVTASQESPDDSATSVR